MWQEAAAGTQKIDKPWHTGLNPKEKFKKIKQHLSKTAAKNGSKSLEDATRNVSIVLEAIASIETKFGVKANADTVGEAKKILTRARATLADMSAMNLIDSIPQEGKLASRLQVELAKFESEGSKTHMCPAILELCEEAKRMMPIPRT